ncbi:uncharacterized protein LOC143917829 [Arctopsyche grandis]|uniref:uncharacterized protein LOC143917829 n=1 Tax=Arctopsyche grandis TaxID=121162 RepID=UPI00406D764D
MVEYIKNARKILVERILGSEMDMAPEKPSFDRVQYSKLMETLVKNGFDNRDIRIIKNLYWHQKGAVKVDDTLTADIKIHREVRQGCKLSPILFNIYSENIFREALNEVSDGITINGQTINNIRYADDTVILRDSMESLQKLIDKVNAARCWLNDQWDHSQEIKIRIEMARNAFFKMRDLLCNRDFNLDLRMRILHCYVLSVLIYGVESWTMTQATEKKLAAFEMWCFRRMLRIPWVDRVRNEEVLKRISYCRGNYKGKEALVEDASHGWAISVDGTNVTPQHFSGQPWIERRYMS